MHWSRIILVIVVLCAAVLAGGCTQTSTTPATAAPSVTTGSIDNLALSSADVPSDFTLAESRAKNQSEISSSARALGWQAGYLVRFISSQTKTSSEIRQTITQYPATNIKKILLASASGDLATNGMSFSGLPSPGLGNDSLAFQGTVGNTTAGTGGIAQIPTAGQPISSHGPADQKFVEILFTKGDIFEVIRMSGEEADYSVLKGIAATAYDKVS
jgi:hypothetical protein